MDRTEKEKNMSEMNSDTYSRLSAKGRRRARIVTAIEGGLALGVIAAIYVVTGLALRALGV